MDRGEMRLIDVGPHDVPAFRAGIVEVYRTVFTEPPWDEPSEDADRFGERLVEEHAFEDDFRCIAAVEGEWVVGFSMGTRWDNGYPRLAHIAQDLASEWTLDCFLLMELAVVPERRGQGIGGRLHDTLLAGVRTATGLLTTNRIGHPAATGLYVSRGWRLLLPEWRCCEFCEPIHVMGLAEIADRPAGVSRGG